MQASDQVVESQGYWDRQVKLSVNPYMGMLINSSEFSMATSDSPVSSVPNSRAILPFEVKIEKINFTFVRGGGHYTISKTFKIDL